MEAEVFALFDVADELDDEEDDHGEGADDDDGGEHEVDKGLLAGLFDEPDDKELADDG